METFGKKIPSRLTYIRFRAWFAAMRFVEKLVWDKDSKFLEKLYDIVWALGEFSTKYGLVWEVTTDESNKPLRERIVSYAGDYRTVTRVFKDWYSVE